MTWVLAEPVRAASAAQQVLQVSRPGVVARVLSGNRLESRERKPPIRLLRVVSTLLVIAGLSGLPAAAQGSEVSSAAGAAGSVRIRGVEVLVLHAGVGGLSATERAAIATATIQESLADPDCGPERWSAATTADETVALLLCDRRVLLVTSADTTWADGDVAQVASRWLERLREVYGEQQQVAFSASLLRRAIVGLLYPLGLILVVVALRIAARRAATRLRAAPPAERGEATVADAEAGVPRGTRGKRVGIQLGGLRLLGKPAERQAAALVLRSLEWLAYLVVAYLFLVGLFGQFPATARWAGQMFDRLVALSDELGAGAVALVPRLLLVMVVLGMVRLLLRVVGQLFAQVQAGTVRMEPLLSQETAVPAELAARALVMALGVLLIALVLPGEAGSALLVVLGLAGFAFAVGAYGLAGNVLGGLAIAYTRSIRRGQRIRILGCDGVVKTKGILHVTLELDDGDVAVMPNRLLLEHPVWLVGRERSIALRVVLEVLPEACGREEEAAAGLFRHAAVESGLHREEGEVLPVGFHGGRFVYHVTWPVPRSADAKLLRAAFLRHLLERAPGMHLRVEEACSSRHETASA